ncbi:Small RNA 2'-O-methyltransferase OS=Streptomyces rimosus subsp. rimosus (strain ATCC / DSM 40260/ JCM 4667 / NRRL 2234) OX=1265868 GN=SRIM_031515 PE=3 SV=1 [Streptomyces rimosus subsp. rimosus]
MFLTITTTGSDGRPATDLGFLLHKHPGKAQAFSTAYGTAHVFYPEADDGRCTAALLLEVDPVALVRRGRGKGRGGAPDSALAQYVNDRPYAASSLLAVALSTVFASALKGQCKARPELPAQPRPLRLDLPAVPARGGAELVRRLFEPLGWTGPGRAGAAGRDVPGVGRLAVRTARPGGRAHGRGGAAAPVCAAAGAGRRQALLGRARRGRQAAAGRRGLAGGPSGTEADHRPLPRPPLVADARRAGAAGAGRLAEADDTAAEEIDNAVEESLETEAGEPAGTEAAEPAEATEQAGGTGERPVPLAVQRRAAILGVLREVKAARVLDLGCGQGQLLGDLLKEPRFTDIVGLDVSMRALQETRRRLRLDRMPERQSERLRLAQGSLAYTDARLKGYDAAVLSEVVEHVDPPRLSALEYAVFGAARPRSVVVTTPNVEYNVRWESLPAGHVRHRDHRFEWTREEFRAWSGEVAERHGYEVEFRPVGPDDPEVGPPTQLAHFRLAADRVSVPAPARPASVPTTALTPAKEAQA